jgi:hypothetical protein
MNTEDGVRGHMSVQPFSGQSRQRFGHARGFPKSHLGLDDRMPAAAHGVRRTDR